MEYLLNLFTISGVATPIAATVGQAASIGGAGLASSNAKNFFFN